MDKSREQFEDAVKQKFGDLIDQRICKNGDGEYMAWDMQVAWWAWQASRAAMTPACWRTYYPDTDEEAGRAHSESGPESCAKRIASEIGGYVVPVYYGEPQQFAAGLKVKGE
ncbi:hypothetical protein [Cronobacter muytjensii]|uniref:hypothetical protein n=1 Tax=Cronobacter muytjensii TaxID=413501 RepID=UPI0029FC8ABB|nr:hypothetical protein [Cronobacter muytjensii]